MKIHGITHDVTPEQLKRAVRWANQPIEDAGDLEYLAAHGSRNAAAEIARRAAQKRCP